MQNVNKLNTSFENIRERLPALQPIDDMSLVARAGLKKYAQEFEVKETPEEFIEAEKLLAEKLGDYEGQWVAVRHHDIVAADENFDVLMEKNRDLGGAIFKVAPRDTVFILHQQAA